MALRTIHLAGVILLALTGSIAAAAPSRGAEEAGVRPVGDGLPNPFPNRTANWAQLPSGMKWGAVVAAMPGPDGMLYVVHRCFENSCAGRKEPPVMVFNPRGGLERSWGAGMFAFPHGHFMDTEGNIWLTDAAGAGTTTAGTPPGLGSQVVKLDKNGKVLLTIGKAGSAGNPEQGLLTQPTAVITNKKGEIFVAEGHDGGVADRVSKFTKDGKFVRTIVRGGTASGQVKIPHCLAFDASERLFVCDRANNRISIFDQEGQPLAVWKQWGRPSGIVITADNTLYVADSESGGDRNPGWKKGIRIGNAVTGKVDFFVPDEEATTNDPSGPESISLYRDSIFGAVVRRRQLERYTK